MSRESIIVPNAEYLDVPVYLRKMKYNENHVLAIKEFSDKYGLGLHFADLYGSHWQHSFVALGHAYIRIEDTIVVYLPERMSLDQIAWFNEHKEYFAIRRESLALEVVDCSGRVIVSEDAYTIQNSEEATSVFKLMYKIIKKDVEQLKSKRARR